MPKGLLGFIGLRVFRSPCGAPFGTPLGLPVGFHFGHLFGVLSDLFGVVWEGFHVLGSVSLEALDSDGVGSGLASPNPKPEFLNEGFSWLAIGIGLRLRV